MLAIQLSIPAAMIIAALCALWIYQDAKKRGMDTADMWAVGFAVGFFVIPIIGGVAVYVYYLKERNRPGPGSVPVDAPPGDF